MTQAYNISCQGESHKKNDNKPCQDYSISYIDKDVAIAIVSDGHGGDRYFRSHFGSQFLSEIVEKTIIDDIVPIGKDLFNGKPFTHVGISKERDGKTDKMIERTMQNLFGSIIAQWYEKIKEHAKDNPLDEWEEKHVPDKYKDEFNHQNRLEKNYGCTLMVYVQTTTYWFAFHIGDGKCIAFHLDEGKFTWKEPILWDKNCFLNTTTSICDSNAIEEFRYSYCGNGSFPFAVFLGSDGIDDSYGTMENLTSSFYIQLLQEMSNKTSQEMEQLLEENLPEISKRGSQDDMSVACVYDDAKVMGAQKPILDYQKTLKKQQLKELEQQEISLKEKFKLIEAREDSKSKEIDLKYAHNDLAKINNEIQKVRMALLESDSKSLKIMISDYEQKLSVSQEQNKELSNILSETNKFKEKLIEELKDKSDTIDNLKKQLQDEHIRHNEKVSNLEMEIQKLNTEIDDVTRKNTIILVVLFVVVCFFLIYVCFLTPKATNNNNHNLTDVQNITQIL